MADVMVRLLRKDHPLSTSRTRWRIRFTDVVRAFEYMYMYMERRTLSSW